MSIIGEGLEILGLIDKAKNADVYRQLGDYIDKVREQQIENDKLQTEIRELKQTLRFRATVERINGHTFVEGDDEELCPRCAEDRFLTGSFNSSLRPLAKKSLSVLTATPNTAMPEQTAKAR